MTLPLHPLQKVPTRDGEMLIPRFDRYVGLSLDLYGEYSPAEREALTRFLSPGDIVVQVGANIGALTIPLARAVGQTGHVIAIEPQELLFRTLSANAVLTGQLHIAPMMVAVGATTGTASLPRVDYSSPGNYGGVSLATKDTGVHVPLVTLDGALKNVPRCRLLHIDAEGSEMLVLQGAEAFIRRTRPVLCLEIDRPDVREALPSWLAAHDYTGIEHRPPLYSSQNFRGVSRNVFEDKSGVQVVSINCLAIPNEHADSLAQLLPQENILALPAEKTPLTPQPKAA